jgi:hypothetical protein
MDRETNSRTIETTPLEAGSLVPPLSQANAVQPQNAATAIPKVAIVGVHGVAHHAPGATAEAMADLLLSLPAVQPDSAEDAPRDFSAFEAVGVHIPLQPLAVYSSGEEPKRVTLWDKVRSYLTGKFLEEESASFASLTRSYAREAQTQTEPGFSAHEFMRQMLYRYRGGADGDTYKTMRLQGERLAHAPRGAAKVHVYEVLWADLASPTDTVLSFLFAFFQLIFHLASLSRLALDSGAAWNSSRLWVVYRRTHRYAARTLQLFIPLLNLVLLVALAACIPVVIPALQKHSQPYPIIVAGLLGLGVCFLFLRSHQGPSPVHLATWVIWPTLSAASAAGLLFFLFNHCHVPAEAVAALESWVLGALLLWWVLTKFDEVRNGTEFAWIFYAAGLALFVFYLIRLHSVPAATLGSVIWLVVVLRLLWMALIVLALTALVLGSIAWRSVEAATVEGRENRARARAAVRTSRFALALPSLMFLVSISLLWASLFALGRSIHDPFFDPELLGKSQIQARVFGFSLPEDIVLSPNNNDQTQEKPCAPSKDCTNARLQWHENDKNAECDPKNEVCGPRAGIGFFTPPHKDYLNAVLVWSVTPGFPVMLGLSAAGFFLLIWWVLPGVLTETFPLRTPRPTSGAQPEKTKPPRTSTNAESERLGSWISRGLDGISTVSFLFWCSIFVAPIYVIYRYPAWLMKDLKDSTSMIVNLFVSATVATGVIATLAKLVQFSSTILGVVLDVDNYLRTSPIEETPRAKIVERYVSLLRYLARYRDPADGRGYDSIVIVAHSLGSLISADLLRFLHEEGDGTLAPMGLAGTFAEELGEYKGQRPSISLKLLTMGNPTRQLLNRFFPYLYDWVREEPDNGLTQLAPPTRTPPAIAPNALPDPDELGVARWVNIYRSGDYVGRSLWLNEWYRRTEGNDDQGVAGVDPRPIYQATLGPRTEMCMGAGAHTHYWDDTAPDVAEQLNALI